MGKNTKKQKTVFVGMSGGVDSSVTAYLLKQQGYHVVGVFMRCYNIDGCAEGDARDARLVAEQLGIPFYVWDFEEAYKKAVVDYMIAGYAAGVTPNPDVMCNREIKFGLFLKKALAAGAEYVATGHYVRIKNKELRIKGKPTTHYSLLTAKDIHKDQSYFLWTLTQEQLRHCLFPVGAYTKPEIRKIAKRAGIVTAEKKDSQGICFLGQVDVFDFLREYIPQKPGDVVTVDGDVVGQHKGLAFYTIGQRHTGIDFNPPKHLKDHAPFYVARKDEATNRLIVAEGNNNAALFAKEVMLTSVSFIDADMRKHCVNGSLPVMARVRYRQPLSRATLFERNEQYDIVFDVPQKFVSEGQSVVFYDLRGEMMVGGGVIAKSSQ